MQEKISTLLQELSDDEDGADPDTDLSAVPENPRCPWMWDFL
jgi:hypothetical protein